MIVPDAMRPRLRSDLEFDCHTAGGHAGVICHDPARGSYFRFGMAEYHAARCMDGQRTVVEIAEHLAQEGESWSEADLVRLVGTLTQAGLAEDAEAAGYGGSGSAAGAWTRAIAWRMPLIDADTYAKQLSRYGGGIFSPLGVILWCLLLVASLVAIAQHGPEWQSTLGQIFRPEAWPYLALAWVAVKIVHEAAHAASARRHGVAVGRAGILLFLLAPVPYVDVTAAWRLRSRWARVQIALAGVYAELGIAALAGLVWSAIDDGFPRYIAFQIMLIAGPATLLTNANPLLRLDGYFALSDALEIPNLAMHGRRQLAGWIQHALLGRSRPLSLLSGWRAPAATLHAAMSVVYQAVWIAGLLVMVSRYFEGLGVVLAALAFAAWVILPLGRFGRRLLNAPDWPKCRVRFAASMVVLGALATAIALAPSPLGARVPVVARYRDAQHVRATTAGFVREVHVRIGEVVEVGDPLLEIENPELELRCAELQGELEAAAIRFRQYQRQGKQALAQAELGRQVSLRAQVAELTAQLKGLRPRAERRGIVLTPGVEDLLGSHIQPGHLLVTIGQPDEKELIGAVAEEDLNSAIEAAERSARVAIRMRGGSHLRVTARRPSPRASHTSPDPLLEAIAGGALAVQRCEGERQAYELLRPRFEMTTPLAPDAAVRIPAGSRGVLRFASGRSLGSDLARLLWHWIGGDQES